MMVLWILHEIMSMFMFWNLPKLCLEDHPEDLLVHNATSPVISDINDGAACHNDDICQDKDISQNHGIVNECEPMQEQLLVIIPESLDKLVDHHDVGKAKDANKDSNAVPKPIYASALSLDRESISNSQCDTLASENEVAGDECGTNNTSFQSKISNQACNSCTSTSNIDSGIDFGIERNQVLSLVNCSCNSLTSVHPHHSSTNASHDAEDPSIFKELFKSHLIALLMTVFIGFFNQTALEALLTPFTQRYLSWNEMENSYLYCAAGVEIILVFLLIQSVSHKVQDKWLITFGLILQLLSIGALMGYVPSVQDGFSQGVRKIFGGLGTLLGPLWPSGIFNNPLILFGVMAATSCIVLMLLILSFNDLTTSLAHTQPAPLHPCCEDDANGFSETTPHIGV